MKKLRAAIKVTKNDDKLWHWSISSKQYNISSARPYRTYTGAVGAVLGLAKKLNLRYYWLVEGASTR